MIAARVCVVVLAAAVLSACGSGHRAVRSDTDSPTKSSRAGRIVDRVASSDGRRELLLRERADESYLEVRRIDGRAGHALYSSSDSCCTDLTWVTPRRIAFVDDFRVLVADVRTGKVRRIADAGSFSVSKDGSRVAIWTEAPHGLNSVRVVSIDGRGCLVVPKPAGASDSNADFLPDGKHLLLVRSRPETTTEPRVVVVPISALRPDPHPAPGC